MANFQLVHEVGCSAGRFFEVFFDREYNEELYKRSLEFPVFEILTLEWADDRASWRIRAQPKLELPGPVEKLLGKNFGYVEEGSWDAASGVYRYTMIPNVLADKMHNSGSVRVEPLGEHRCRRVVDVTSKVNIFGLGGVIESIAEKAFRDNWRKSAEYMTEFCARKRGA